MKFEGLSEARANELLIEFGPNVLPSDTKSSPFRTLASILREPMLLLLVGAGGISFILAERLDGILLISTVFIIVGISIFQESKTERALAALRELSSPQALVIRSGIRRRIPSSQLVPGDLIQLLEGDRVPADADLLDSKNLQLDESLLTGESIPVSRAKGERVFTGTLTVQGHGLAIVRETGSKSELGRIGHSLSKIDMKETRLQESISRIVRAIGIAALLTVSIVIVVYGLTRGNWLEGSLAGIAVAMAIIPEELPVILTIFMALGAWRMARVKVIVRKSATIESLGSVTVLCVDKTGTLTRNEMEIEELLSLDNKKWRRGEIPSSDFQKIINVGLLATPITAIDPMDRAFKAIADEKQFDSYESVKEFPLTKERLIYAHVWRIEDSIIVAAKGAPEHIAHLCNLDEVQTNSFQKSLSDSAQRGYRVIGIAKAEVEQSGEDNLDLDSLKFTFLGLALLHDPIREGVPEAIFECKSAGIRTVMITGDHPITAMAVATQIGLTSERCVTGVELSAMTDKELADTVKRDSIFARVSHEHKLRLIKAFQAEGHVVGMTGDGINDAPALRAADIGMAMGARGTDVAREASAMIITDDNFTSIVAGIRRGRTIYANIKKAMGYVIAIHIPIFGMAIVPILNPLWPLVFLPALVAFHEIIIDPACSIVYEVEEPDPMIMREPPRPNNAPLISLQEFSMAIAQGLSVFALIASTYFFCLRSGDSDNRIRSLTFSTLLICNIFLIMMNRSTSLTLWSSIRKRRNRVAPWIVLLAFIILIVLINVPLFREAFDLEILNVRDYFVMFVLSYISLCWVDLRKKFPDRTMNSL